MPYVMRGTVDLLRYWNVLGRPCERPVLANAIKSNEINFMGRGRDRISFSCIYGEKEAQNLAAALGTTVANVSASGGQYLI